MNRCRYTSTTVSLDILHPEPKAWVSCVLSDGFPVLFFIQSNRLGFLCAQWWVSCTLLHPESQVGFPVCSVMGFLYSFPFRVTGWVSCEPSDVFSELFSIQSNRLGFLFAQWCVSCSLLHSEKQVGFPVCSVMGFLYSSPFRVTGWVSCVLSDRFPVLFSIQSNKLGFLCAQWWVSCILSIQSNRLGFLCAQSPKFKRISLNETLEFPFLGS